MFGVVGQKARNVMPLLTAKELSEHLKIHPERIGLMRRTEGMPAVHIGVQTYRYDLDKVLAWFESRQNQSEVKRYG
jgi:hypothetical protein